MWEARADLHTHSTCSDGTQSPEEVVAEADIAGLSWLALTDHDCIDGIARAGAEIRRRALPLTLITGAELSAFSAHDDVVMHILAYGFRADDARVAEQMADFRNERSARLDRILALLAELDMPLKRADVLSVCSGESVGRPHIAYALKRAGYVQSTDEAFRNFLRAGGPAYVPRKRYGPEELIAIIHSWPALAVLAHPYYFERLDLPEAELEAKLERCIAFGLDGLECWHTRVDKGLRRVLKRLARRHGLLMTGGSDSHGNFDNRPRVGGCTIGAAAMEPFLAALGSA
jgi:predicted metal-dependent phosphoesterase TrpH